ncbi:MAG TPA: hypothetical protein VNY83_08995, partial [Solirubrobacterales bacterium]|nr:hypothetical protein [Solirubrobacterales bacterium]
MTFGSAGSGDGQFSFNETQGAPGAGVAVDNTTHDVYVVDTLQNRIEKFGPSGNFLAAWGWGVTNGSEASQVCTTGCRVGNSGSGNGQFTTPVSVAVDNSGGPSAGDVYVADRGNDRIEKFGPAGNFLAQFGNTAGPGRLGDGSGTSETFRGGNSLSVNPTNGDVWAADTVNERVVEYSPGGSYLSEIHEEGGVAFGLAVDASGNVYIVNGNGHVEKHNSSGAFQYSLDTEPEGETVPRAIAIDASGDVFVGDNGGSEYRVLEYGPGGDARAVFGTGSIGISTGAAIDTSAGNPASGTLYLADNPNNRVDVFVPKTLPTVTTGAASNQTLTGATLNGTVNPEGIQVTGCLFEYGITTSYGHTAACAETVGSGNGAVSVHVDVSGLEPGHPYHFRLVAENANGSEPGSDQTALTLGPTIGAETVSHVGGSAAQLEAQINPNGTDATYHFEYGTTTSYGHTAPNPDGDLGSGSTNQAAVTEITGLEPDTVYHYRVVAIDVATGPQGYAGPDATFTTNPALGTPRTNCPNPAHTGLSARLPDCRAYELLTPPNKGDGEDMYGDFGEQSVNGGTSDAGFSSEDGNGFYLTTLARFGPSPASGQNGYVFSRGPGGWQSTSLAAPGGGVQSITGELLSPDLSQVGIDAGTGSEGNLPATRNVGQVGPVGGPYTTLFDVPHTSAGAKLVGASADFSRVFLQSTEHNLIPGGLAETQIAGSNALYEYSAGHYSLLNVKTGGASLTSSCGARIAGTRGAGRYAHAVSADGSRVFFESPDPRSGSSDPSCYEETGAGFTGAPPQLYTRSAGLTTEVSAPEAGVVDPHGPQPVAFAGASADGSRVFFITRGELTSNDLGNHEPELYEYDTQTEHLTRVSRGASGNAVGNVGWVVPSADGSAVYFTAGGRLAPGAPSTELLPSSTKPATYDLYRYDTSTGATAYIAQVSGHDWNETVPSGFQFTNVLHPLNILSNWQATPNGRYLLFDAVESLTGYNSHDPSGHCSGDLSGSGGSSHNCGEVYRYDNVTGSLLCLSCNPSGAAPSANALFDRNYGPQLWQVRAISGDGSTAFFDTTES